MGGGVAQGHRQKAGVPFADALRGGGRQGGGAGLAVGALRRAALKTATAEADVHDRLFEAVMARWRHGAAPRR